MSDLIVQKGKIIGTIDIPATRKTKPLDEGAVAMVERIMNDIINGTKRTERRRIARLLTDAGIKCPANEWLEYLSE